MNIEFGDWAEAEFGDWAEVFLVFWPNLLLQFFISTPPCVSIYHIFHKVSTHPFVSTTDQSSELRSIKFFHPLYTKFRIIAKKKNYCYLLFVVRYDATSAVAKPALTGDAMIGPIWSLRVSHLIGTCELLNFYSFTEPFSAITFVYSFFPKPISYGV